MVCKIDLVDLELDGWKVGGINGLIDIEGSKENPIKTDDYTSVNEVSSFRYRKSKTVVLQLFKKFSDNDSFEQSVVEITGLLIQTGERQFQVGPAIFYGFMADGLMVTRRKSALGRIVGEMIIKVLLTKAY